MPSISGMSVATPTDDPILVYQNVLFALDRQKQINNGEPFLHVQLLGALAPTRGNVALHIGCGTGYYTAILTHLVGPSVKVIASPKPAAAPWARHRPCCPNSAYAQNTAWGGRIRTSRWRFVHLTETPAELA